MEQQVLVDPFQQVSSVDFNRFGQFPTDSIDHIVGDIGIPGLAYSGFPVTAPTQTKLTVGNGRFFKNGPVYASPGAAPQDVDLTEYLPAVTFRWLAVTIAGYEDNTNPEQRTFLTDVKTRASVGRTKPTIKTRIAKAGVYGGAVSPDPIKPVPPADLVTVAFVKVGTTGVISIENNLAAKAPSIAGLAARLDENDEWRKSAGGQIDTLRSDIANIAGRFVGLAPLANVVRQGYDIARLKDKLGLPQTYAATGSDRYLDLSQSDVTNADYLAKVEEGIRFPDAQIQNDQIGLLNVLDPNVVVAGNVMLPAYDLVDGLSSIGTDLELSIANFAHTTVQLVQKTIARTRVRFGAAFNVCQNSTWWQSGRYDSVSGVFVLADGETFANTGTVGNFDWPGHYIYRVQQFWTDSYVDTYWDSVVVPEGVTGYSLAQTFNNTQERFIGEIGLYFSRKAALGDVKVALCECFDDCSPNPKKVIAKGTITPAQIVVGGRTPVTIVPTLLGVKRYAIIIISEGNHYLWQTVNNKFGDGTLFNSTDGGYYAGVTDLTRDLSFDLKALQFRSPRVEVQLNPLGLPGGIVNIDVLAQMLVPGNASIDFAVLQNGAYSLLNQTSRLVGLPAGLPFKAILSGTTAVMPGLGVLSNSRVRTTRPRADFKHISTARVMPANVQTVRVQVRLEWWKAASHTFACKLRTGAGYATINTPASVVEAPAQDDPINTITREYFFSFAAPGIGSYKIEMSGTTTNVVTVFHVGERVDIGIL